MTSTPTGSKLADFELLSRLGKGSFGEVHKVRRVVDGKIYVMKRINIHDLSPKEQMESVQEVNIMASMDSPYIVRYYDSFIDFGTLCIIMEYCDRGDLQMMITKQAGLALPEDRIWKIFLQTALGIEHLHSKRILHRDVKCANVFLCSGDKVKIGDLGVARVLGSESFFAKTVCGTPYFLSPELVEGLPYNEKSDVWALGCVLYELCTGKHAFKASNQAALMFRIIRGEYTPIPDEYSPDLHRLVAAMLTRDTDLRPNISEILADEVVYTKLIDNKFLVPPSVVKIREPKHEIIVETSAVPDSTHEADATVSLAEPESSPSTEASHPIVAGDLELQDWQGHDEDLAALALCDKHRFEEELPESIHVSLGAEAVALLTGGTLRRPLGSEPRGPPPILASPVGRGMSRQSIALAAPGSQRPVSSQVRNAVSDVIRPVSVAAGGAVRSTRVRRGDPTGGVRPSRVLPLPAEIQHTASNTAQRKPQAGRRATDRPTVVTSDSPDGGRVGSGGYARPTSEAGARELQAPAPVPVAQTTPATSNIRTTDALAAAAASKRVTVRHLHALSNPEPTPAGEPVDTPATNASAPASTNTAAAVDNNAAAVDDAEEAEDYEDDFEPEEAHPPELSPETQELLNYCIEEYRRKKEILDNCILRAKTFVSDPKIVDKWLTLKDADDAELIAELNRLKPEQQLLMHKIQAKLGELKDLREKIEALSRR